MSYPKVKDFLSNVVTGTHITIEDDITEDCIYFRGTTKEYFDSNISLENLTLIQSSIKNNILYVRVMKDYKEI